MTPFLALCNKDRSKGTGHNSSSGHYCTHHATSTVPAAAEVIIQPFTTAASIAAEAIAATAATSYEILWSSNTKIVSLPREKQLIPPSLIVTTP
jgi:hypothetical protein